MVDFLTCHDWDWPKAMCGDPKHCCKGSLVERQCVVDFLTCHYIEIDLKQCVACYLIS